jgi:hypothetical protein
MFLSMNTVPRSRKIYAALGETNLAQNSPGSFQRQQEKAAIEWLNLDKELGRAVRLCHAGERFSFMGSEPFRHLPAQESQVISGSVIVASRQE